jgi:3-deoxy-D-manno-octulosonic-acid transferase
MHFLYNIGIRLYKLFIVLASPFNLKAKQWLEGRKQVWAKLAAWRKTNEGDVIWVHAASLGEFEQGRPLIEKIKSDYPQKKIVLTFFSPSGYEVRKNYSGADLILYLPLDTPQNAVKWLSLLTPEKVFFVKYEYWANYFFEIKKQNIPLYVVSGIFREDQRFFKGSAFWRSVLESVHFFFLQNKKSGSLLSSIGLNNYEVCGDTRYDRVVDIKNKSKEIELAANFTSSGLTIVAGSSYREEESVLLRLMGEVRELKLIIAPHHIDEGRISEIVRMFETYHPTRFSDGALREDSRVLVIDNMGMLSSLYRYGKIAVIGGGFGKGIHNTLEAAVYGMPVVFGKKHEKFEEAVQLVNMSAAVAACDLSELEGVLRTLLEDDQKRMEMGQKADELVKSNTGAVSAIFEKIDFQ